MANIIKKIIPRFVKDYVKNKILNTQLKAEITILPEKNFYCPVCNKNLTHFDRLPDYYFELFDKYQYIHSIFCGETFNLLKYSCPNCGAADRDRLYALYLKKRFSEINQTLKYKFIDFAPAPSLANFIKSYIFLDYRSADLLMEGVDDKADLTNLTIYKDESVDFFLCSHMLEHIQEDVKAMQELYRILKNDGWGILMVPISLSLKTIYENPEILTEEDRWKHFGQNDHVRMYSKQGFIDRVKSVGFKIQEFDINYFGEETFDKCGIHHHSVLYIVSK